MWRSALVALALVAPSPAMAEDYLWDCPATASADLDAAIGLFANVIGPAPGMAASAITAPDGSSAVTPAKGDPARIYVNIRRVTGEPTATRPGTCSDSDPATSAVVIGGWEGG
jgi:hypothetical protein